MNTPLAEAAPPVYAGFWIRFAASMIDTVLLTLVMLPLGNQFTGGAMFSPLGVLEQTLLSAVLPAIAVMVFWIYRSATPGKMLLRLKIVDAAHFGRVPAGRLLIRYLGYYVSAVFLCLGFFWVGFDAHKQGWHDKLANTLVIREPHG